MKIIEVTDEMYGFLMNLSKELTTQNHRGTAMPYFFQIQTREEFPTMEGNGQVAWVYDGTKIETEEEITEAIADYKEIPTSEVPTGRYEREKLLEEAGYSEVSYDIRYNLQNAFLTSKACDEHIRLNNYHYDTPINYLSHSFRNPEMEKLMTFICGLTGKEIHT